MSTRFPRLLAKSETILLGAAIVLGLVEPSQAALTVSSAPTKNVACTNGVCSATAAKATLNVTDLQNLLAAGNVSLVSGSVAGDIVIDRALAWANASTLTLDAYHSITVEQPISVESTSGLTLTTNDGGSGGTLTFMTQGSATFWDIASSLTINGAGYTLVGDIASFLADDISATPSGHFALAKSYDAGVDGTYADAPITTGFTGDFEGLGNAISNLTINASIRDGRIGLFANLDSGSVVEGLVLSDVFLTSRGRDAFVAAVAAQSLGLVRNVRATGKAHMANAAYGGLVSNNWGTIADSSSAIAARINNSSAGGLVAINGSIGTITESFSTGDIKATGNLDCDVGGLLYLNTGIVANSYATGSVLGGIVGGVASANETGAEIENSYATGQVGGITDRGGIIGNNHPSAILSNTYWDITTTQTDQGCGFGQNCTGATGLTDTQLKSGLPAGFDPSIWGQSSTVNGGYPYLLRNPAKK